MCKGEGMGVDLHGVTAFLVNKEALKRSQIRPGDNIELEENHDSSIWRQGSSYTGSFTIRKFGGGHCGRIPVDLARAGDRERK